MQLSVETLTLARGHRVLAHDLSFTVAAGEALLLKGPNGAGKTTLLRTLAGLLPPIAGRISFEDERADPDSTLAERCHFVGHANAVKPTLTARENLEFWTHYLATGPLGRDAARAPDASRLPGGQLKAQENEWTSQGATSVVAALEQLGIAALSDIRAGYFSAGQRRRLALARLITVPRPLWLLDEPSVSLDAEATATLADMLRKHVATGGLVIAATHIELGIGAARELRLGVAAAEAA